MLRPNPSYVFGEDPVTAADRKRAFSAVPSDAILHASTTAASQQADVSQPAPSAF
eukprot:NODE_28784_length_466_cov_2.038348.p2 GENE.NODE_28784_length_466_cov_2.038348~~NODE_28784_length_466_cov_2.038348.p2  ORF type:complete len:55 (+),score=2.65 NODE_28784_length_466_cov_2.038348:90-254(+)